MTKRIYSVITLVFALAAVACAQTAAPVSSAANLPSYTVGAGPSWTRGGSTPYGLDVVVGVRIGQTQWCSWIDVSTPVSFQSVKGAASAVSAITTGGAFGSLRRR